MIDVSSKNTTERTARAGARLKLHEETVARIREKRVPKGDPLEVARVAAVQAAKNTSAMIPFCHPIPLDHVGVDLILEPDGVAVEVRVKARHRTGVEMEALCAASAAALTVYDMIKAFDPGAEIVHVRLLEKRGGKTDFPAKADTDIRAAALVLSDSAHAGKRKDTSGRLIVERLKAAGVEVAEYAVLSDDEDALTDKLMACADEEKLDLVLTTGGTGFGPRDRAPEALLRVMDREVPGISEAARDYGQRRTPFAMLSRGRAGIRGSTLIVNLPGSPQAVAQYLDALFPGLLHAFPMIRGGGHDERRGAEK